LLCDGVVGDYVLEMYELQLNFVSEKEVCLKNEEIKKMKEEKERERIEKDKEIKKLKEEKEKKECLLL
jgi:hypothetical protein